MRELRVLRWKRGHVAHRRNKKLADFPDVAAEFHPTKNYPATPETVGIGMAEPVWWVCPNVGPEHDYDMRVNHRIRERATCPYCSGHRVSSTNSLAVIRDAPALAHGTSERARQRANPDIGARMNPGRFLPAGGVVRVPNEWRRQEGAFRASSAARSTRRTLLASVRQGRRARTSASCSRMRRRASAAAPRSPSEAPIRSRSVGRRACSLVVSPPASQTQEPA